MTHTFKVGDKGKTRGGDDYEVIYVFDEPMAFGAIVLATVKYKDGQKYPRMYTSGGKFSTAHCLRHHLDLIPPERRITGWVLLDPSGTSLSSFSAYAFDDLRHAQEAAAGRRGEAAIIPINVPVGTGLGGENE